MMALMLQRDFTRMSVEIKTHFDRLCHVVRNVIRNTNMYVIVKLRIHGKKPNKANDAK